MTRRPWLLALLLSLMCACVGPTASTSVPGSPPPTVTPTSTTLVVQQPPDLVVVGESRTRVPGFDYCWTLSDAESGVCADSFGAEVPVPVSVDGAWVTMEWVEGGVLTAYGPPDSEGCGSALAVDPIGRGQWRLAMPPEPGTHQIYLGGEAPEGTTRFAIEVTSSVEGPPPAPVVEIGWPDTDQPMGILVTILGIEQAAEMVVEVHSADNQTSTLTIPLLAADPACPELWGQIEVADPTVFGLAPLTGRLSVENGSSTFKLDFLWPDNFVFDDTLRAVMYPTSGR